MGSRRTHWETELPKIVEEHPGSTVGEIINLTTRGKGSVGNHLLELVRRGVLYRTGKGGEMDPFRYYKVDKEQYE